jgi:hypothetical protein
MGPPPTAPQGLLLHALPDAQPPPMAQRQLDPGVRGSSLVTHGGKTRRIPAEASLPESSFLPARLELALPPVELTRPQSAPTAEHPRIYIPLRTASRIVLCQ